MRKGSVKTVSSLKHAIIGACRTKRTQKHCANIILHHHANVSDAPQGKGNSLASSLTFQFTTAIGFNTLPFHRVPLKRCAITLGTQLEGDRHMGALCRLSMQKLHMSLNFGQIIVTQSVYSMSGGQRTGNVISQSSVGRSSSNRLAILKVPHDSGQ